MSERIDSNSLIYYFNNSNLFPINFSRFKDPMLIYNDKKIVMQH